MDALITTTYYPSILLRQRWQEKKADPAGTFGLESELTSIHASAPLTSAEVSVLERWSAGGVPPSARDDHPGTAAAARGDRAVLRDRLVPVRTRTSGRRLPNVQGPRRRAARLKNEMHLPVAA